MLGTTFHQMQCQHIVRHRARRIILLHPKRVKSVTKQLICITLHRHHRVGMATLWGDHLQTVRCPTWMLSITQRIRTAGDEPINHPPPSMSGAQSSGHYDRTQPMQHHPAAANAQLNSHSNSSVNNNDNRMAPGMLPIGQKTNANSKWRQWHKAIPASNLAARQKVIIIAEPHRVVIQGIIVLILSKSLGHFSTPLFQNIKQIPPSH